MGDLTKGETFAAGEVVSASRLHALVENATINAGAVGTTELADGAVTTAKLDSGITIASAKVQIASGKGLVGNGSGVADQRSYDTATMDVTTTIGVKALGIAAAQIAADAVTTAKILDGNVTGAKLETLSPSPAGSVGSSSAIPVITIDSKGRVTAATTASISGGTVTKYASSAVTLPVLTGPKYVNFAHGLGAVPRLIQAFLVCTTSDLGHVAGDVFDVNQVFANSYNGPGLFIAADATNVTVTRSANASSLYIGYRLTGVINAITEANWQLKVVAWL